MWYLCTKLIRKWVLGDMYLEITFSTKILSYYTTNDFLNATNTEYLEGKMKY